MNETENKSDDNLIAAAAYALGFVSGLIIYLIEKDKPDKRRFVMFHAMQAIILGIVWFVVIFIPFIGQIFVIVTWIFMMYKAYSGEEYHFPIIGDMAEKQI